MRRTTVGIAGLAALFAASPFEASAFFKPSGKFADSSGFQLTASKKKASAAKSCGAFMYRKGGKCVDAREKK